MIYGHSLYGPRSRQERETESIISADSNSVPIGPAAAVGNGSWFGPACASEPAQPSGPIIIPWAGRCTWRRSCPRRPPSPTSALLGPRPTSSPSALRQVHRDCCRLRLPAAKSPRMPRRRRRRAPCFPSLAARDSETRDIQAGPDPDPDPVFSLTESDRTAVATPATSPVPCYSLATAANVPCTVEVQVPGAS